MRMKNVISWSIILLLTIIPLGGCAVNSSLLFVDTNETEYYEGNWTKDENQTEIISFENYTENYDLNITNAEIQLNQTFDSAATSVSLKTPVVYVDTDGTGNYNCDGTNDHVQINQALSYINGRGGGTVYLRGPNTYWIDSTLNIGANTLLTGDSTAEIKLVANAGWASQIPLIRGATGADNIIITGFIIDGNSESQSGIPKGQGYYNLIHFQSSNNVEVSHMRLEWGTGDGMKVYSGNGIKFLYNDVYKLGHDVLYAISCSNVEHAYNTIMTRTNSGCRYSDGCTDSTIHDNLIYSSLSGDSTGPAIQIGTSSTSNCVFDDIEIYNNRVHTTNGAGIWMSANYQDNIVHARDVHIHHNTFTNVGQYKTNTGFSNAAIVLGDFDNTIIENNVFDDGGHAAIKWYLRDGRRQQKIDFTTYVRNNIIMNNDGVSSITGSGVGIWNTNPTYCNFVVQNNDIYNNKNGQTYGGSFTMKNNLNVDPLCVDSTNSNLASRDYHLRSKAGRYSSGKWIADSVSSPLIDAGYSSSSYISEPSPNGGKINIGRYGNTVQASKSGSSASTTDNSPVANAGADKTATVGSVVSFDASASTDDKGIASYSWDFDASNGITSEATGKTATKTYTTAGTYTVTLAVTDTSGQESTDTLNVVVSTTPVTNTELDLAIYDNRLRETAPTTVYSDSNYIDIGQSGTRYRDVMWFDLSEYNTTDTVSRATLSLYWYYPAATRTSDTVVEVYRPLEWDPKYVSWNSRTSTSTWTTAGGNWYDKNGVAQGSTPYATLMFPRSTLPGNKYYEFDVTQLVQEYVSGKNKNTGFFLKAKTESNNYIAFYSSDWSNAVQRPKLTVTVAEVSDNVPVANAGGDKTATTGSAVSFDGSASTDDKGIASYSWDFDASNGITSEATGKTATKTYTTAGMYTVTLTVTDTSGQKATDTVNVVVSTTPVTNTELDLATYDNRLREAAPTTVYSDSSYLDIGKSTSACRDVMWFDLSEYKTTDTVSKATLSLYWYYPTGATRTSDTVVEVYRPVEWDPKYVSWNSRTSTSAWTTAGGNWYDKNGVAQGSTPYASLTFPAKTVPGNKYCEFDVTQLVQEYVSGKNKNTGFFLKAKTESGNYIAFYSSEWSNTAQRPKLTVTTGTSSTPIDNVPVANAGADKTATTGSAVSFDGSASTDDKGIASYSWDFDASNGITSEATGKTATKTYTTAGTYTVTLTVTDTGGQKATDTVKVIISATPVTNTEFDLYDNRLVESSKTTVYSSSNYLDIGKSSTRCRDLMWFDLSEYKTTDAVSKATLSLYWYYPTGATRTSDTVVEVYRPVEWDPKYVTWNNRASGTSWSTAGGNWYDKNGVAQGSTPYASLTFPAKTVPGNKYYEFDVTQLVQEYVSGKNKNTGFFLKAKTESGNYIAFYSSDWSNAAQRPKLTVTATAA